MTTKSYGARSVPAMDAEGLTSKLKWSAVKASSKSCRRFQERMSLKINIFDFSAACATASGSVGVPVFALATTALLRAFSHAAEIVLMATIMATIASNTTALLTAALFVFVHAIPFNFFLYL